MDLGSAQFPAVSLCNSGWRPGPHSWGLLESLGLRRAMVDWQLFIEQSLGGCAKHLRADMACVGGCRRGSWLSRSCCVLLHPSCARLPCAHLSSVVCRLSSVICLVCPFRLFAARRVPVTGVAAPRLRLEFARRMTSSPLQQFCVTASAVPTEQRGRVGEAHANSLHALLGLLAVVPAGIPAAAPRSGTRSHGGHRPTLLPLQRLMQVHAHYYFRKGLGASSFYFRCNAAAGTDELKAQSPPQNTGASRQKLPAQTSPSLLSVAVSIFVYFLILQKYTAKVRRCVTKLPPAPGNSLTRDILYSIKHPVPSPSQSTHETRDLGPG